MSDMEVIILIGSNLVGEFPFPPNEPPPIQLIHLFLKDAVR